MALPVGRGLFTLFSYHPVPTEPLPVPKLNLTGAYPSVSSSSLPLCLFLLPRSSGLAVCFGRDAITLWRCVRPASCSHALLWALLRGTGGWFREAAMFDCEALERGLWALKHAEMRGECTRGQMSCNTSWNHWSLLAAEGISVPHSRV